MAVSRTVDPPDSLANIPHIYLNTSERNRVCLLSAVGGRLDTASSCSLPNLLNHDVEHCGNGRRNNSDRRMRHTSVGEGNPSVNSVHATPTTGRRARNSRSVAVDWLTNKQGRRDSNGSSEEGEHFSMMSISNLSTCATSDYTHLTSWDKLSVFSASTDALEWAPGKLRRVNSNPDNAAIEGNGDARAAGSGRINGSTLSDSHSFSNLRKQTMLDEIYDPTPRMLSHAAAQRTVEWRAHPESELTPGDSGHRRALYSPTQDVTLNRDSKVRKWLDALNT